MGQSDHLAYGFFLDQITHLCSCHAEHSLTAQPKSHVLRQLKHTLSNILDINIKSNEFNVVSPSVTNHTGTSTKPLAPFSPLLHFLSHEYTCMVASQWPYLHLAT